jgi:hypothetical protein
MAKNEDSAAESKMAPASCHGPFICFQALFSSTTALPFPESVGWRGQGRQEPRRIQCGSFHSNALTRLLSNLTAATLNPDFNVCYLGLRRTRTARQPIRLLGRWQFCPSLTARPLATTSCPPPSLASVHPELDPQELARRCQEIDPC